MSFPSTPLTKSHLDQGTDSPAAARTELAAVVDKINAILSSYATALGICDLDENGKVPVARFPQGVGSGTDADLLDGQHGAYYRNANNLNAGTVPAARFADSSHGNRSGGSLHPAATQAVAGFMSAADKQALDGVPANIDAAVTTSSVLSKTAGASFGAVGTYAYLSPVAGSAAIGAGSVLAGSSLRQAGIRAFCHTSDGSSDGGIFHNPDVVTAGAGLAGTWRCMGYSPYTGGGYYVYSGKRYGATLWLRIS